VVSLVEIKEKRIPMFSTSGPEALERPLGSDRFGPHGTPLPGSRTKDEEDSLVAGRVAFSRRHEEISQQEGNGVRSKASKNTKTINPMARTNQAKWIVIKRGWVNICSQGNIRPPYFSRFRGADGPAFSSSEPGSKESWQF
jgi:MoaA/NifB/PqqE/SkfB family radical SAM enzyme